MNHLKLQHAIPLCRLWGQSLEQLPDCIDLLHLVSSLESTPGLGTELAHEVADPDTRFSATCDALARADRLEADGREIPNGTKAKLRSILEYTMDTNKNESALLDFSEAMTTLQRSPISSDGFGVAELGLRTALETVEAAARLGQVSRESLIAAVAGEISETLARRDLVARSELRNGASLQDAAEAAARIFIDSVWLSAFGGQTPSAKQRRVAFAIYRFGFMRKAARSRSVA